MEDELEELIQQLEEAEQEFNEVRDDNASGSLKEKQQRAEQLLDDIHEQLDFLRAQMDQNG